MLSLRSQRLEGRFCDGQLIFTAPIQVIKLLSTAVTRFSFCLGLLALVKVCLHWSKKIQKINIFKF